MILLYQIAEKILSDIRRWPTFRDRKISIDVDSSLTAPRDGDEVFFADLLTIPAVLLLETSSRFCVRISGDEKTVHLHYDFEAVPGDSMQMWKSLAEKIAIWNPRIQQVSEGIIITITLPALSDAPPVDLEAMARETGIEIEDARQIVKGFIKNAESHISILREGSEKHENETLFRAAHSLKGAGRTLRSPELAAAAGALEQKIKENMNSSTEQRRLESIWDRIEIWFKGSTDEGEINPLRGR